MIHQGPAVHHPSIRSPTHSQHLGGYVAVHESRQQTGDNNFSAGGSLAYPRGRKKKVKLKRRHNSERRQTLEFTSRVNESSTPKEDVP
ncbi:hypothetical protein AVEN_78984-1 [Araneus ventricosus]|uniref:Uncharacterized protein n=1 Tax=Araneus ventricosus TaxID=182803 RepID=A0A4Y2SA76_ARAVE|nr:hypothetical protein AVEN_78984-1 [Araneus ventricosus]